MRTSFVRWSLLLGFVIIGLLMAVQLHQKPHELEWVGSTMGTTWTIVLGEENNRSTAFTKPNRAGQTPLVTAVQEALDEINSLMSTWDPNSELSRFNASKHTDPIPINASTLTVVNAAQAIAEATNGAYDVTRGNVFALWGFAAGEPPAAAPSAEAIDQAMQSSGWENLTVLPNALQKKHPDLTVDLSSLAKGYAVDQLGILLEAQGIDHYLVNIGGEIRSRGRRSKAVAWQVGVEQPDNQVPYGLELADAHVATSGDYRNVRIIDGQRVSHLIDARTGLPIDHALVAVTVLHQSTMLADAWATAFIVLGADEAKQRSLAEQIPIQLTLLSRRASDNPETPTAPQFELWQNPGWEAIPKLFLK